MTHLDLFSGIGGFSLAADTIFGDVEHTFCDNDKFCQAVLKKHWPESEIFDDIRQIQEWRVDKPVDLLTGGFPCQPFSAAGLRRGTADDRHLWPEMLRIIQLTEPTWVIAENVRGIINWNDGLVFEQVCADLEASGYEVQPFIIPAVAVNAPHRRDRVWFVAHYKGGGSGSGFREIEKKQNRLKSGGDNSAVNDAERPRLERYGQHVSGAKRRPQQNRPSTAPDWSLSWPEVATELCSVDDGLPARVGGLEFSKSQHRKEQLKAYGNAIVPQVAMEIMRGMI